MFCEPRKRKTHGPKIIGHTPKIIRRPHAPKPFFGNRLRGPAPIQTGSCRLRKIDYLCYAVHRLHAFLTYRVYKRLYLSALNLVNFLKTPCTTSPGRVCVVFRCRRFTRTSGVTDSAALFFFGTNESIWPHSCRCNRIICDGRMLSDNRILPTKESCVTFFLPPFFFTFSVRNIFRTSGRPSSSAA